MNILNQQLSTFVYSSSLQSVKILLEDATSALKNNDITNALRHLNLVKQQLASNGDGTTTPSPSAPTVASPGLTNVQANQPLLHINDVFRFLI